MSLLDRDYMRRPRPRRPWWEARWLVSLLWLLGGVAIGLWLAPRVDPLFASLRSTLIHLF